MSDLFGEVLSKYGLIGIALFVVLFLAYLVTRQGLKNQARLDEREERDEKARIEMQKRYDDNAKEQQARVDKLHSDFTLQLISSNSEAKSRELQLLGEQSATNKLVTDLRVQVSDLQGKVNGYDDKVALLKLQLEQKDMAFAQATADRERLEMRVEALEHERIVQDQRFNDLHAEYEGLVREKNAIKNDVRTLTRSTQNLVPVGENGL